MAAVKKSKAAPAQKAKAISKIKSATEAKPKAARAAMAAVVPRGMGARPR